VGRVWRKRVCRGGQASLAFGSWAGNGASCTPGLLLPFPSVIDFKGVFIGAVGTQIFVFSMELLG